MGPIKTKINFKMFHRVSNVINKIYWQISNPPWNHVQACLLDNDSPSPNLKVCIVTWKPLKITSTHSILIYSIYLYFSNVAIVYISLIVRSKLIHN